MSPNTKYMIMEIKLIDDLLSYFYIKMESFSFFEMYQSIKDEPDFLEIDPDFIKTAIDKLVKDGFVDITTSDIGENIFPNNPRRIKTTYKISFEGIIFHLEGGYREMITNSKKSDLDAKNYREEASVLQKRLYSLQKTNTRLTYLIAAGALIASVYSGFEIAHYFGCFSETNQKVYIINK